MLTAGNHFRKRWPLLVVVIFLALAVSPALVSAQAVDPEEDVEEASNFQNPTQAQKAANVARAAAMNSEDATLADRVAELEAAQKDLEGLTEDDPGYADALAAVEAAEAAVEARLAEIAGVTEDEIAEKRANGYGWGQICHELGVHPSVLGNKYGHQKATRAGLGSGKKGEIAEVTKRDVKTGWARGHAKSASGKANGKAKAGALGKDDKSKGKSSGKGSGKGGGKGGGKDK